MTAELQTIFTIGVYGSTEESFFGALVENEIELFIDIRARRGMRGSKYKYVNSTYAPKRSLKERKESTTRILKELAPTKEIRALQWQADKTEKTNKRDRLGLSESYINAYNKEIIKYRKRRADKILDPNNVLEAAKELAGFPDEKPLQRYVLFCVEQHADACHRSLVAARFRDKIGGKVKHL